MQNLFERLKVFSPRQMKNYIKIEIPIVMFFDGGLLGLKIKTTEKGYEIICPRNLFADSNGSQEFYFNIFEKYDKNIHFDIKIKNGKIYKEYSEEYNIAVAVNEFIRFFIMFDDFFINNDVIGHEENFAV